MLSVGDAVVAPHRHEGFRNRYKGVGHGNCGRMQPAVAVQQRVGTRWNCVLWLLLQSTASLRRQCSAKLTSRGWAATPSHGTGRGVRLRKTNSRIRQVRFERRAMECAGLRTVCTDFCFKSVANDGSSQCAEDTMSTTSCRVGVPPKRERELPQTSSPQPRWNSKEHRSASNQRSER